VLEARNGEDALVVCEQHKGPIQLLLTDVIMPEMNGPQLAERLAVFHLHLIRRQIATHKRGDKAGYHSHPRWLLHPSHQPTGGYIELGAVPRASQDCALQPPLAYWGAQVRTAAADSIALLIRHSC